MNINFEIDKWNNININYKYKIETINNVKYLCYDKKNKDLKNLSFTMDTNEIMKKAMIFVIICVLGIGGIMWHKDAMVDNLSEYITNKGLEQAFGTSDYEEIIKNKVMSEKKEVLDVAFSEDENGNHVAYLYLENGNVIINKFDSNWNYIES